MALLLLAGLSCFGQDTTGNATTNPEGGLDQPIEVSITTNDSALVYYNKGLENAKIGKNGDASRQFTRAIELDPNFALAYMGRANVKFLEIDFDGGLWDYDRAVELTEESIRVHRIKGKVKRVMENHTGSTLEYARATTLEGYLAEMLYRRGNLKMFLEDKAGCCDDLTRAKELGYMRDVTEYQNYCK